MLSPEPGEEGWRLEKPLGTGTVPVGRVRGWQPATEKSPELPDTYLSITTRH
jgi:hypothetical protein